MHTVRVRTVLIALPFALLLATASGCGHRAPAAPEAKAPSAAFVLRAIQPERQTVRRTVEEPGQIEAFEQTPIYANIPGYVSEVCVDMDAEVKKGQPLARLWVPEREDDVHAKEAQTNKAQAGLVQSQKTLQAVAAHCRTTEAMVAQVKSERKRAQANCERWQSESHRIDELVRKQVIDSQTRDETRNQLKAAQAACEEIEAKIHSAEAARDESVAQRFKAEADVTAAQSHLRLAESETQRAKTMLAYAEIKAPFDGIVTQRNVHTGHLLQSGSVSHGEPLFVVVRRDPVRIFVEVPEPETPFVHKGTSVRLRIQGRNDREFEAKVTRTSWALNPATRTLRVEIEVPNPKHELRPGNYAYAIISVEHAHALTLPTEALLRQDNTRYCWQFIDGKAVRTLVRTGLRAGSRIEVLKKRLPGADSRWQDFTGKEQILLGNVTTLTDGKEVSLAAAN